MSKLFRDARLKVQRANKHIADLETAISVLKENYTAIVVQNIDTGHQDLIHAIPDFAGAADEMALIAGDAIHNLKTALDFAWMSTLRKHVPIANLDCAKFPVYPSRRELESALNGVPINARSNSALFELLVSDIQPFEGGHNGVIYVLHKLDICDKHLLLLGLVPLAGIDGIRVQRPDGETVRGFGGATQNLPPYVIPFDGNIRIKEKGRLTFHIVLKEAGIYGSVHIMEVLPTFSRVVSNYIGLLERIQIRTFLGEIVGGLTHVQFPAGFSLQAGGCLD